MKTRLLVLQVRGVRATTEGADVPSELMGRIDCAVRALEKCFPLYGVRVGGFVHLGEERVEVYSEDTDMLTDGDAIRSESQTELAKAFFSNHQDVCDRYQTASETNEPVAKRREDAKTLLMNETLWNATGTHGSVELLPDEKAARRMLVPRDPSLLRAVSIPVMPAA